MLKVAVGHSLDPDASEAILEVIHQCKDQLAGHQPQAGILLATIDTEHQHLLETLAQVWPDLILIGGTTCGEISSVHGFQQDSLVLMVFASDTIQFAAGVGRNLSSDPARAAQQATQTALTQLGSPLDTIKLCLTVPESLTADGADIVKYLSQSLGNNIPIVGGTTADDGPMQDTYQFYGREVLSDALPILCFSGPIHCSIGVGNGWNPIGQRGQVTSAKGNWVYEINHQHACLFYERFLGSFNPSLSDPLTVITPCGHESYLRTFKAIDQPSGAIAFTASIPEGAWVQLSEASRDEVLLASKTAFDRALATYSGQAPEAILLFSCISRKQILGTQTREEYQLVRAGLNQELPCVGFYTYGEIAPLNGLSEFHNNTFVVLLLGT
jgi:hypothetical protein